MSFLVSWIMGAGLSKGAARIVSYILLALVVLLVLWGAKCAYDKEIVEDAFTEVERDQAREDREADREAGEQRREDDERLVKEQQELKDVLSPNVDPDTRKREFYRCIRLQQAARQNGLEPPTCV